MTEKNSKMWNRDFINILIVQFCLQMGQQMMNTLVPKFADSLGAAASIVGLVSSIFSVSSTLILIFASPAFDCYSRKKLMMFSIAGMVVAFGGYAMTATIPMLFVFRLLQGACQGCIAALGLVMVSDALPNDKLGKGISVFTLCQAVGQAVGPSFGLKMSATMGYRVTFLIGAAAMLLGFLFAFRIREPKREKGQYRLSLGRVIAREAIPASILILALQGPYCCISSFIAIYGALRGVADIGLYFTVYAVCLLATRPISGTLVDKIGPDRVLICGIVCFGIAFLIISLANTLWMFLLAAVFSALGYGVCQPTLNYMCMSCVPASRRGAASSTSNIGMSIGFLLGVTGAGYVVDLLAASSGDQLLAYSQMYQIMILPMAFALVYFLFARKRIREAMAFAKQQ